MKHESRFENILHERRKTQKLFNPLGDMTTADAISIGLDRAQASFLRTTLTAINTLANPLKRSRFE